MTRPLLLRTSPPARGQAIVIVGAGQAGAQAAYTLREGGFAGRVVLLGDEAHPPYMRPPLSKKVLADAAAEERIALRPDAFYPDNGIELRLGTRVEGIDRAAGVVHLAGGERLAYDRLLLATGARARPLAVPGAHLPQVHCLRSLDDARRLRAGLRRGVRVAIVGGGYVGLEGAATAAAAGARVSVLELGERVLARVTTPGISDFFTALHAARGVEVRCGARVAALQPCKGGVRVAIDGGPDVGADIVLVGIGAQPNDGLARDAGLPCDDGIVVDERCRTADPAIYAAGDCTRHPSALLGRRVRLESVQNAVDQASVAAANMAGGDAAYARVPWFWSHQYECRLQSAGIAEHYDEVVERGDRAASRFALVYRRAGRLVACDAVNMPGEYLAARRELESRLAACAAEPRRGAGRQAAA